MASAWPRPLGLSGWVTTAAPSPMSKRAAREGTANSGVPMKTMRGRVIWGSLLLYPGRSGNGLQRSRGGTFDGLTFAGTQGAEDAERGLGLPGGGQRRQGLDDLGEQPHLL